VWLLHRLYGELRALGVMNVAVKGERLLFAIGRAQIFDEFERWRLAQIVIESKRLEIIGIDARHEPELHASADDLVNECNFLRQPQRVIQRHHVTHRTDTHAARARRRADNIEAR
jgi:hypothetical protein